MSGDDDLGLVRRIAGKLYRRGSSWLLGLALLLVLIMLVELLVVALSRV